MSKKRRKKTELVTHDDHYSDVLASMVDLLESSRRASARAVNAIMTATYWEIGRRLVELEQGGDERAEYGDALLKQLAVDLTVRFGRGFAARNLYRMRRFYIFYAEISPTVLAKSEKRILPTVSAKSQPLLGTDLTSIREIANGFPLPWSHYDKLLSLDDENARRFYEEEALRGGWSVRQLNRQINSQFYERTLLSKNKATMLRQGAVPTADDLVTPQEEIKDPFVLEFLDLKDEYSETCAICIGWTA
jgi:hypothetical protein